MIEMRVMGIALDTRTGSPIVVLHDKDNRKALPIWIGSAEASAIIRKLENLVVARPMTHDLFLQIFEKTESRLDRVEIFDVENETTQKYIDNAMGYIQGKTNWIAYKTRILKMNELMFENNNWNAMQFIMYSIGNTTSSTSGWHYYYRNNASYN